MSGNAVGVVGLGQMGLAMARRLAAAGFAVAGHDLSAARRELAAAAGIATDGLAATAAPVVVLSLPRAADVEATVAAILPHLPAGAVVVDTSTSEPAVSRRLAATLAGTGRGLIDAPVSGGPAGAEAGTLTVMAGGDAADLDRARPVLDAVAAKVIHVGPSGAGNVAKLVNNMLVAAHMVTAREAMALAEATGVPAADALAVVNAATGRSAVTEIHVPRFVLSGSFGSGFSAGLMRKDLALALDLAAATGADVPLAREAARLWAAPGAPDDRDDFTLMARPVATEAAE